MILVHNVSQKFKTFFTRFTNSLRQHKPSFGIKIVLSGLTEDIVL